MKVLAIGGSNSRDSINRKLATYAASLFEATTVEVYNLSEIDIPLYSMQLEQDTGVHAAAKAFADKIDAADVIVLSLAENNGSYNAGFKNLMDWTSRVQDRKTWGNTPMLLMATSPGKRGGITALEGAAGYFPYMGADVKATFSLPQFYENFDEAKGITEETLNADLVTKVNAVKASL